MLELSSTDINRRVIMIRREISDLVFRNISKIMPYAEPLVSLGQVAVSVVVGETPTWVKNNLRKTKVCLQCPLDEIRYDKELTHCPNHPDEALHDVRQPLPIWKWPRD